MCPTFLRMINFVAALDGAKQCGGIIILQKLRAISETTLEGFTLKNIAETVENIVFRTLGNIIVLINASTLNCVISNNDSL